MDSINEDGPIGRQRKSQNVDNDPFTLTSRFQLTIIPKNDVIKN